MAGEHANQVLTGSVWETEQKGEHDRQWTAVVRAAAWRNSEWTPGSALTPAAVKTQRDGSWGGDAAGGGTEPLLEAPAQTAPCCRQAGNRHVHFERAELSFIARS